MISYEKTKSQLTNRGQNLNSWKGYKFYSFYLCNSHLLDATFLCSV